MTILFYIAEEQQPTTKPNGKAGYRSCHVLSHFANRCFLLNGYHHHEIKAIFHPSTVYGISSTSKYKG